MKAGRSSWKGILILAALLAAALLPAPAEAAHDLGRQCYDCHNIRMGTVWSGSYSIWSQSYIGQPSYTQPIACDFCHPTYGSKFSVTTPGVVSHHPVPIIDNSALAADYSYGTTIRCSECHGGNTYTGTPVDLVPDLAPVTYSPYNILNSGYPNHDVSNPNNDVVPGDNAHYSAGYLKIPSASGASATNYALCFLCHDGSTKTSRRANVRSDYDNAASTPAGLGHYFQGSGTGVVAGDRLPCSDCHGSHSGQNARLYASPKGTMDLDFLPDRANPTDAQRRAICNDCHYYGGTGGASNPTIRGRLVPTPPSNTSAHPNFGAGATTTSCTVCHPAHNPRVSTDCLSCHTGGSASAKGPGYDYSYIDNLFKGVGPDGGTRPGDSLPLSWSQHGGFPASMNGYYEAPYGDKSKNFCMKCHGDRHAGQGQYALINPDPGDTGGEAYVPTASSLRSDPSQSNANNFCLGCHDGDGAAGDVSIGGLAPPVVSRGNWTGTGHGKASGPYSPSNNSAANLKCIDCHEVHGSNHRKLLPADNTAAGGFAMPAGKPGMTFRSGSLLAKDLDFRDYTDYAVANRGSARFDNNWKSDKGFGTTGDPADQYGSHPAGATTGLCDACHRDDASVNQTLNKAHTHMGIAGQGSPVSQMSFVRDCGECHDPHGGTKTTPNIYMVSDNLVFRPAGANQVRDVTFRSLSGTNSFDDNTDAGGNAGDLCTVCHETGGPPDSSNINVGHNYYTSTANPDHKSGQNCLGCHPHGVFDNEA